MRNVDRKIIAASSGRSTPELVIAARAGEKSAFRELVERHLGLVSSLAYAMVGSFSDSEDIAQETFIVAWRKLPELRRPDLFRAWLCRVTRFVTRRALEKRQRLAVDRALPGSEPVSGELSALEQLISWEEDRLLWQALKLIPESHRTALVLYYREQQSLDDIAQALELTTRTAQFRLISGRRMLR